MGKLLAELQIECVNCNEKSIPLVIRGVYFSGKGTTIQECPICGHMSKLGEKLLPKSKSSKARQYSFPYGRFARELTNYCFSSTNIVLQEWHLLPIPANLPSIFS